jgi:serine/threonine-protein kinase
MATVHLGRLLGPAGFSRTVAVKRLHAHLAKDPEFVSMFLDEARLAARIRHPNVVPTLDVISEGGELFLVMEYVRGESLSRLVRAARADGVPMPLPVVAAIVCGVLHGLHAAHEATSEGGEPLDLVHRDVSPQNIIVGGDGAARVLDFGVAKAVGRLHNTRDGSVKGKPAYMAPEQLTHGVVDRRADIYAAGVVLWELLTGERLFNGSSEAQIIASVLDASIEPPSKHGADPSLDDIVMRAVAPAPSDRFGTARQMAREIEQRVPLATAGQVGEWVEQIASDALTGRSRVIASIETSNTDLDPPTVVQVPHANAVVVAAPPPRRSRAWIAFAAGLLLALLLAWALRSFDRVPAPEPVASTPAPPPSPAPSPSAVIVVSAPAPSIVVSAPPTPKKVVRAPKGSCVVKSYVDSAGVKHYFNDCPK